MNYENIIKLIEILKELAGEVDKHQDGTAFFNAETRWSEAILRCGEKKWWTVTMDDRDADLDSSIPTLSDVKQAGLLGIVEDADELNDDDTVSVDRLIPEIRDALDDAAETAESEMIEDENGRMIDHYNDEFSDAVVFVEFSPRGFGNETYTKAYKDKAAAEKDAEAYRDTTSRAWVWSRAEWIARLSDQFANPGTNSAPVADYVPTWQTDFPFLCDSECPGNPR